MHDRSAYYEVFRELVLQVRAEKRLTLHEEVVLALQLDIYVRAGLQDRGVENRHRSHRVIDGIIHVLHEFGTACCHRHTSARHVHRTQPNLTAVRTFVLTRQAELILLSHLLGYHQGRVVQLLEAVFLRERTSFAA